MPKINTKEIEDRWQKYWEDKEVYKFSSNSKKPIYSIDTPPPTVSGKMHIGHACSYSQEDFIARYKRMQGFNVFYPFGTDDNGLPTEKLIERLKKVKSKKMDRQEFIKLCVNTLKEILPDFIDNWKNLGISCDYENTYYSTIDEQSQKISQASFIEMLKSNEIEMKEFPTLYCPDCQTPIAQAELEDKNKKSNFLYIKAKVSGLPHIIYATTRPELLHACVCITVHPDDKRYKKYIGKIATIPISNAKVPIIADEFAKMEFGTGAVYWCPYGDKKDIAFLAKHPEFKPTPVIQKDGTLNEIAGPYNGMKINEAREKITQDLQNLKVIEKIEQIDNVANVHDKCGTEIEFLLVKQWFAKVLDKKAELLKLGKKVKWHPKFMYKRYEDWIKGLEWDWSISRERHFGIPVPVWHCTKCDSIITPKKSELPIDPTQTKKSCPKCNSPAIPDTKVLDTWATSSLTPKIAAERSKIKKPIPYSLRPQGHDIIRTWAFYTIVKSLFHDKSIPWKEIMISGFVKLEGEKMSKSKGNVVDAKNEIGEHGADSIRYWAASSKLGEDFSYYEKDVLTGKKFITKILNATNFVFTNMQHQKEQPTLIETDRLFLAQLNTLIKSTTEAFTNYNYSKAKLEADSFFWKTFADNYLEIIKNRIYNGTPKEKASASYTLYHALLTLLKLFAPITPYITEELYQKHFKTTEKDKSIHLSTWPTPLKISNKKTDQKTWGKLIEILYIVRQAKSLGKKSMNSPISLSLPKKDQTLLEKILPDLRAVTTSKILETGPIAIKLL